MPETRALRHAGLPCGLCGRKLAAGATDQGIGAPEARLPIEQLIHAAEHVAPGARECLGPRFGRISCAASERHSTTRTHNYASRVSNLGLAFELIEKAEKPWRRINGPEKIELLLQGIAFKDGEPLQDDRPVQRKRAA